MMSTQKNIKFKNSSEYTKTSLTNSVNWTNFGKKFSNNGKNSNYSKNLRFCQDLETNEVYFKLQEGMYINCTMKKALKLSANESMVLGAMYGVTRDSGLGYLTNKCISYDTGLSVSSIKRYMNKFESLGIMERAFKFNGSQRLRNYRFTKFFFEIAKQSGNKCIKEPDKSPEFCDDYILHEMVTKPMVEHGSNWSINNTSILDNISTNILSNNKVNISINTYTKVNSKNSKTKVEPKNKLVSYNELINNFVDLNYQEGQEELKKSLKRRLQVIYGTRRHMKEYKGTKLKLTNKELKSTLDKLLELSKGNAGKALTIVQYSNTQYYSELYEPNQKTCIAYKDKAYSSLIKKVDCINSRLDFNNPRYEENLKLKYKCLNRLSTWYKVRNNLLPTMRPVYDGTKDFEEVDNAYSIFASVNEGQEKLLNQTGEQGKVPGEHQNCQWVENPIYNLDENQKIKENASLTKLEVVEEPYDRSSTPIICSSETTYDLGSYEKLSLSNLGIDIQEAYDTPNIICNYETTFNSGIETYIEPKTEEKLSTSKIYTPPPNSASPPSPSVDEYIRRGDLGGKQGQKSEKCKFIPPRGKSGLNKLKTAKNEKPLKSEKADPQFVHECIERARAALFKGGE